MVKCEEIWRWRKKEFLPILLNFLFFFLNSSFLLIDYYKPFLFNFLSFQERSDAAIKRYKLTRRRRAQNIMIFCRSIDPFFYNQIPQSFFLFVFSNFKSFFEKIPSNFPVFSFSKPPLKL